MNIGFDKPLYIQPFDHRGSFQTKMFGWKGKVTEEQTAQIASAKQVIYDGFKTAATAGVPKEKAGILVDEQFGAAILRDAAANGYLTACPAEKSGQDEFDFEYGEGFSKHIEAFAPTFCKVLVRFNPEGDKALNQRQSVRLKRLSDSPPQYRDSSVLQSVGPFFGNHSSQCATRKFRGTGPSPRLPAATRR
jgi:5-dehydro-2-deoxygluconokinase